jgi:hypothetical protein
VKEKVHVSGYLSFIFMCFCANVLHKHLITMDVKVDYTQCAQGTHKVEVVHGDIVCLRKAKTTPRFS